MILLLYAYRVLYGREYCFVVINVHGANYHLYGWSRPLVRDMRSLIGYKPSIVLRVQEYKRVPIAKYYGTPPEKGYPGSDCLCRSPGLGIPLGRDFRGTLTKHSHTWMWRLKETCRVRDRHVVGVVVSCGIRSVFTLHWRVCGRVS